MSGPDVVNRGFSACMKSFFKRFSDFTCQSQAAASSYIGFLRAGKNPPWRDPAEPADLYQSQSVGFFAVYT